MKQRKKLAAGSSRPNSEPGAIAGSELAGKLKRTKSIIRHCLSFACFMHPSSVVAKAAPDRPLPASAPAGAVGEGGSPVQISLRVPQPLLTKVGLVAHASTAGNLTQLTADFYEGLVAEHAAFVAAGNPFFRPLSVNLTGVAGALRGPQAPPRTEPAILTNIPVGGRLKVAVMAAAAATGLNLSRVTRCFYEEVVAEYEAEHGELPVSETTVGGGSGEITPGETVNCFLAVGSTLKRRAMQAARARGTDLAKLTRRHWEQLARRYEERPPAAVPPPELPPLSRVATFEDSYQHLGEGAPGTYGLLVNVSLKQRIERASAADGTAVPVLTRQFWSNLVRSYAGRRGPIKALGEPGWRRAKVAVE